jgi:hypothetical protein
MHGPHSYACPPERLATCDNLTDNPLAPGIETVTRNQVYVLFNPVLHNAI